MCGKIKKVLDLRTKIEHKKITTVILTNESETKWKKIKH